MNWISNVVPPKIRSFLRRETPENLWVKCPDSGELVFHKDLEHNLQVVPELRLSHAHAGQAAPGKACSTPHGGKSWRRPRYRPIRSSSAT